MNRSKSFHGASLDDALSAASSGLSARLEELHYDVVEEGVDKVVVEAEVDPVAVLGLFLSETFRAGALDITAHILVTDEGGGSGCRTGPLSFGNLSRRGARYHRAHFGDGRGAGG
jgi:hypothetical protein